MSSELAWDLCPRGLPPSPSSVSVESLAAVLVALRLTPVLERADGSSPWSTGVPLCCSQSCICCRVLFWARALFTQVWYLVSFFISVTLRPDKNSFEEEKFVWCPGFLRSPSLEGQLHCPVPEVRENVLVEGHSSQGRAVLPRTKLNPQARPGKASRHAQLPLSVGEGTVGWRLSQPVLSPRSLLARSHTSPGDTPCLNRNARCRCLFVGGLCSFRSSA